MPRRKSPVTQADLTRVAKAMSAAGVNDWQVEVEQPDGAKIRISAGKGGETATPADDIGAMIDRIETP